MTDDVDRRIIDILSRDGRRPYTAMAAELEVSEATVRARIARLQESEVVRIVALCNPLTLGHQPLRVLIAVRDHSPRAVGTALIDVRSINHIALCTGSHDVYVEATCRDLAQVRVLLDDMRRVPGVATMDIYLLTEIYKDYSWVGLRGSAGQGGSSDGPAPAAAQHRLPG